MARAPANRFKVPKKQWVKWTPEAQRMFNKLYAQMRDKELFLHPSVRGIGLFNQDQWKTTRWNAAWIAADIACGTDKHMRYV